MNDVPPAQTVPRTVRVERVMGTVVSIDLRRGGDHRAAAESAAAWFREVDARFSTYRADSEVSRFARGALAATELSSDLAEVVAACDTIERLSGGAFSARRDGGFDPSAYVKGWSVMRAADLLRAHGCEDWSINAGGDVLVATATETATPWRIGIRHPFDASAVAHVLSARAVAVATSGRYERGDHIEDPRTALAATGAVSVTVCGPDLGLADAFSTAAFVLGEQGPAWVAQIDGYECWTVLTDGRALATAGFPRVVAGVPIASVPVDPILTGAA